MDRLPKKLHENIHNSGESLPMGWGVHIIEGHNRQAIFWMPVIFVCLSLVASSMWTVLKGDIQGGFGFRVWMVSVPSVLTLAFVFNWSDD
jgi:nitrate reductase NapE component